MRGGISLWNNKLFVFVCICLEKTLQISLALPVIPVAYLKKKARKVVMNPWVACPFADSAFFYCLFPPWYLFIWSECAYVRMCVEVFDLSSMMRGSKIKEMSHCKWIPTEAFSVILRFYTTNEQNLNIICCRRCVINYVPCSQILSCDGVFLFLVSLSFLLQQANIWDQLYL